MTKLDRRTLLRGMGATLALPLLESLQPRAARAQAAVPTRFVIFTTGEGTLLRRWRPPAGEALQLSEMLRPLEPYRAELNVISGVRNLLPRYHESNGHNAAGHTLLTAHLCETSARADGSLRPDGERTEVQQGTLCVGPSIDHALAAAIGDRAINLTVNGSNPAENRMFYRTAPVRAQAPQGARAEALLESNPVTVFDDYLASADAPAPMPSRRDRLRSQRGRVLDAVRQSYRRLSANVSAADRARLEAHAARIEDLEGRLTTAPRPTSCGQLSQALPDGYGAAGRVDLRYQAQIDNLVLMLSCNVARVVSLQDVDYHGPSFPMLVAPLPANLRELGAVALPQDAVSGWHAQIHGEAGGSPNENSNLIAGFVFYATQFAYLLRRMREVVEPNGMTLLDNSVVLWISEFGDGAAHSTNDLPVVLAGSAGGRLPTGRHLARPGASTGDLYTSILRLFDVDASSFGFDGDSDLNSGGISGLA